VKPEKKNIMMGPNCNKCLIGGGGKLNKQIVVHLATLGSQVILHLFFSRGILHLFTDKYKNSQVAGQHGAFVTKMVLQILG